VIDSNILERDVSGKPLHTFPHPALVSFHQPIDAIGISARGARCPA
jgi:hypothetical protein